MIPSLCIAAFVEAPRPRDAGKVALWIGVGEHKVEQGRQEQVGAEVEGEADQGFQAQDPRRNA